jgi:hypothetical protein
MDWIDLAQGRDLQVPQNSGKFLSGCRTGGALLNTELLINTLALPISQPPDLSV